MSDDLHNTLNSYEILMNEYRRKIFVYQNIIEQILKLPVIENKLTKQLYFSAYDVIQIIEDDLKTIHEFKNN